MYLALLSRYSTWVLIALGSGLAVSIVAFVLAYRTAKKAPYFAWRQEAASRARRLLGIIFTLMLAIGGTVWVMLTVPVQPVAATSRLPSPSATPTSTPAVELEQPSGGTAPSPTATSNFALPATATSTPAPTDTPTRRVPTATPRAINVNASMEFLTFAHGVSESNEPVQPTTEFAAHAGPVYAFFKYANMANGIKWTFVWLNGDVELTRETLSWEWGKFGQAYLFFGPPGGYDAGNYRLQIYSGNQLLLEAGFTVK